MGTAAYNEGLPYSGVLGDIGSQSNESLRLKLASFAIQCQKRHHYLNSYLKSTCLVVILLLAFLRMLSFQTFKKSLGKRGQSLTDTQIEELRISMYKFSNAAFDGWQKKIKKPFVTQVRAHKENGNCVTVYISEFFSMNVYA